MLQTLFSGLSTLHQLFRVVLLHAADHLFLTGDFTLLIVVCPQLRLPALAFLGREGGVVAIVAIDLVVFHLKNSVHRSVQKVSVVGNYHDCSLI